MKHKLLLLSLLLLASNLFAKQIDTDTAMGIANKFLNGKSNLRSSTDLNLVYTATADELRSTGGESVNYYYVFNKGNNSGYIIVAADDVAVPVIAYSNKGSYDMENQSPAHKGWMNSVKSGIAKAIANNKEPDSSIKEKWQALLAGNLRATTATPVVGPLITTIWGQFYPYNSANGYMEFMSKFPSGCVATAMAQIMNYHKHPESGTRATEAYVDPRNRSVESVDITQYRYDWDAMLYDYNGWIYPNNDPEESKVAVANLMYHCGLTVQMDYGEKESGAMANVGVAFNKYFDYEPASFSSREDFSESQWISLLKNELDNSSPVYYVGNSETSSHAFVCDGYDDESFFHFNFGWNGNDDAFYNINAPMGYSNMQKAVYNIKPKSGSFENNWATINSITPKNTEVEKWGEVLIEADYTDNEDRDRTLDFDLVLCDNSNEILKRINVTDAVTGYGKYCMVGSDFPEGTYRIRAVYGNTNTFIATASGYVEKYLTVKPNIDGYKIVVSRNIASTESILKPSGYPIMSTACKNLGSEPFNGYLGLFLVDDVFLDAFEIFHIEHTIYNKLVTIPAGETFELKEVFNVPADLSAGGMYMMLATKKNLEDEWEFLEDNTYADCWGYLSAIGTGFDRLLAVTPKDLVIANKVYDGTKTATVSDWGILIRGSSQVTEDLRIKPSSFSGEFSSANVGSNRTVQLVQSLQLEGALAGGHYVSSYTNLTPAKLKANITKAPLTIKAKTKKIEPGSNPASAVFTEEDYTIEGFVNGEDKSVFTSQLVIAIDPSITSSTPKGTYPGKVLVSGAAASNYDITFESGNLEITDDLWTNIPNSGYTPFDVNISPNPVQCGEAINISVVENTEKQAGEAKVEIFNPQGAHIMTSVLNNNSTVFLPETQGVYIVRITVDNYSKIAKLIVK